MCYMFIANKSLYKKLYIYLQQSAQSLKINMKMKNRRIVV